MNRNTKTLIPFSRPILGEEEVEAVTRVIRSGWLTTGPEASAFETEFASLGNMPFALALNSATAGLHLALKALDIKKGDKVAVPALTFTATAEVVRYLDAEVVFCDSEENHWQIDADTLIKTLEKDSSIKAVIPVHFGGTLCDIEKIISYCRPRKIKVIEDAAHCFPYPIQGKIAGSYGDAGVFSFYANKTITTGEGGMLVCRDPELARKIKTLRLHGISKDVWDRYTGVSTEGWKYDIVDAGYKYNMGDMAAALGRVQLKKGEHYLARRREIISKYRDAFVDLPGLILPPELPEHSYCHLFVIRLTDQAPGSRDDFMNDMSISGIGTSLHYIPLPLMSYYKERYQLRVEDFPHACKHYRQSVSLPALHSLNDDEIATIIDTVTTWFKGGTS